MKPYAVSVTIGGKVSGKEFDNARELNDFLAKAEELKKKAPTLIVTVTRNGLPQKKAAPKLHAAKLDPRKEESLCWERTYREGAPLADYKGDQIYKCVPVARKPNVYYCPYCHSYKKWGSIQTDYDLVYKGCETCEISDQDFNVKTANSLWKGYK